MDVTDFLDCQFPCGKIEYTGTPFLDLSHWDALETQTEAAVQDSDPPQSPSACIHLVGLYVIVAEFLIY